MKHRDLLVTIERAASQLNQERHQATLLLRRAQSLLRRVMQYHLDSVKIGQLECVADTGVIEMESLRARRFVEDADTLAADLAKQFPNANTIE